jgi:hypothetical protein
MINYKNLKSQQIKNLFMLWMENFENGKNLKISTNNK